MQPNGFAPVGTALPRAAIVTQCTFEELHTCMYSHVLRESALCAITRLHVPMRSHVRRETALPRAVIVTQCATEM